MSDRLVVAAVRGLQGVPGDVSLAQLTAAIDAVKGGVSASNDTLEKIEDNLALKAPLASPGLTGNPTAPTPSEGNNSTQVATTAYADRAATNMGATKQTLDALLTSVSNLSTSITGVLLFTGGVASVLSLNTSTSLAGASNTDLATSAAVKAYVDALITDNDAMVFKGVIDCSANPNYPAGDRGHVYKVSVAGKIGGVSGPNVEIHDQLLCITDSTASGNHATVGANWSIIQGNVDGAVVGPASVTDDLPAIFDGVTGKLLKSKTYAAFKTLLALVKGDVGLGSVDNTADAAKSVATAAALTTARTIDGVSFNGTGNITVIAPGTHAASTKATPVDADEIPLVDSAASNVLKNLTWANLKAALKTYFDSLTTTLTNKTISGSSNTLTVLAASQLSGIAPPANGGTGVANSFNLTTTSATSVGRGQYQGTNTNDAATAGNIGEVIASDIVSGSAVSLVTATAKSVTSISLTAGDWFVSGTIGFVGNIATQVQNLLAGSISTTNNTVNTAGGQFAAHWYNNQAVFNSSFGTVCFALQGTRLSLSGTTTVYLVGYADFNTNTCSAYGKISAKRLR